MPKNRLQKFIELHSQAEKVTTGEAHEIHQSFLELGLILADELNYKRDKKKSDFEEIFGGIIPKKKEVLFLRNPSCGICGKKFNKITESTVDHIKPRALGGSNDLFNLQLACTKCNHDKADKYNKDSPNGVNFNPTKSNIQFMLEESNHIEGVFDKKALAEAYQAWLYIIERDVLTTKVILNTHRLLMASREDIEPKYKGAWRDVPVWIGGVAKTQGPIVLESLMQDWCADATPTKDTDIAKKMHIRFEGIHPFIDGNGRMGRILMNWQLVKGGGSLLIIEDNKKQAYYKWFQEKK